VLTRIDGPISVDAQQTWRGKVLPTVPFQFYRLTFRSRAASLGYWVVFPFDAVGAELRADTHSSVYASADWLVHETCFRGLPGAVSVELGFRACDDAITVRDIEVTPVDEDFVRQWGNDLYATLPPASFEPAADRLGLIPRTLARLQSGEAIRVVMLGDSISQDTCNSYFDIFVEPAYPGADLQLVPSVDGSKGCWHYLEDAHFERYVVDQRPDLLMVGTASEHNGIEPVERLLRRVRDTLDCEVMVVSGAMGDDHRFAPDDDSEAARKVREHLPRRRAFAHQQAELCRALEVEYLDLCSAWLDYLDDSGKPRNWFHRDAAHANDRGKQILARIAGRHFVP